MSDVGDDNFMRYVYMGQEGERIPRGATHVIVHESATAIRARTFLEHFNIVEFGNKLERIEEEAFQICNSLERITIPLKDGIITDNNPFLWCENLNHANLVEEELLREIIAALQLEEWRNDMHEEIDSINQILPTSDAGSDDDDDDDGEYVNGGKAHAIRRWIRSVLGKIMHHKAQHLRLLEEDAAPTLQRVLPHDIVINSVLPFLEVP